MAISVNTDMINLLSRRNLSKSTNALSVALERMSTGFKINSAKDDAAGLYIATNLDSQIRGLKQAQKNIADGMSLLQTADGALENMTSLLNRLRDLSVQGANSVYDAEAGAAFQKEADELLEELERLQKATDFNGLNLFGHDDAQNPAVTSVSGVSGGGGLNAYSSRISLLSAAAQVPLANNLIEGSINFAANETQTVTIDGVEFSVTNKSSVSQSFSYVKNTTTGELTLNISNFTVKGLTDTEYNILLNGSDNTIHTGEKNDIIRVLNDSLNSNFYTYGGDDSVYVNSGKTLRLGTIDFGDGDDYLEGNIRDLYIYGRDGNDTFKTSGGSFIHGGAGNDTFVFSDYTYGEFYGEEGEDTFDLTNSSSNRMTIDGGSGTNSVIGSILSSVNAINVPGANNFVLELAARETKTILINGISYEITNTSTGNNTFLYSVKDDTISFNSGKVVIKGEKDKVHKVAINDSLTFYGGDLNDIISANNANIIIYGGAGDDEITSNNTYASIYGEDGNDHIILKNGLSYGTGIVSGGDGDDVFDIYSYTSNVRGDAGNDTFNIYGGNDSIIICGEGNDTVNVEKEGLENLNLLGGEGTNVLNGTLVDSFVSNFDGYNDVSDVTFANGETKTIVIGGKTYEVKNKYTKGAVNSFQYYYDSISGQIRFSGNGFIIRGQENVEHNVIVDGTYMEFYGGDKEDKVVIRNSSNYVSTGAGDDEIRLASNCYANSAYGNAGNDTLIRESGGTSSENRHYGDEGDDRFILDTVHYYDRYEGESGNDTFYINGSGKGKFSDTRGDNVFYINSNNNIITTGSGNDTFKINGDGNTIVAQGGNDYFEINGSNNNIDGGTETNYSVVISGSNNTITNLDSNPYSGVLTFDYSGEIKEFTINGKKYTVQNNANSSIGNPNKLVYNLNPNTGELKLNGSDFTITGEENVSHDILLEGSNNNVITGNLNDKVIVESGSNNMIDTGNGDDNITLNSENNSVNAGGGNDRITLNASSNLEINAGDGNDRVTVNADNNTNIQLGAGNDTAAITGSGNYINTNEGQNSVTATGDLNNITGGNGNNTLNAIGNNNSISTGAGNNTLGVNGSNNTIVSAGTSSTTVIGNQNNFQGGKGEDRVVIKGNENNIKGGASNDTFSVQSGENNYIDGEEGYRNILNDRGVNTQYQNIYIPEPWHLRLQVGPNAQDSIEFDMAFSIEGVSLDFSSAQSCMDNINIIDELLNEVSSQRSQIGAVMNRLDSVSENQISKIENYTAAKSTIMDADLAQESANFVKAKILQNTTSALIASAQNVRANLISSLLQGL